MVNLKNRALYSQMQGNDVRLLQLNLKQLNFSISSEELKKKFFGPETSKAVSEFQKKNNLESTGIANIITMQLIDDQIKAQQSKSYIVHGQVRQVDGHFLVGAIVRAFDKDIRSEDILGQESITDLDGYYEINYLTGQFKRAEKDSADLFVRVFNQDGLPLATSNVIFNAQQLETIDLVIGGGIYKDLSEYEQLIMDITPVLQGLSIADLTEDEKNQDISFLTGETGQNLEHIAFLVLANRMAKKTGIFPEVFYAFYREKLPTNLPALLALGHKVQRRVLELAIDENIIPYKLRDSIDKILQRLQQLIIDHAFEDPQKKGRTSLSALLGTIIESTEKQKTFLTLYSQHKGQIEDFWHTLRKNTEFQNEVEDLQFTFQVAALSWNHLPMVRELQTMRRDGAINSLIHLARLDIDDWISLINKSIDEDIVGFPIEIPGKNQSEKINNYAQTIVSIIKDIFPTAVIASQIAKDDHVQGKDDLVTFFTKNEDFDLMTTYIPNYLVQNQDRLEGVMDKVSLSQHLLKLQRLAKLTPEYSFIRVLSSDGLDSAHAISRMGRTLFVKKYEQELGDQVKAETIYENAVQTSSIALNLLSTYGSMSKRIDMAVLPSRIREQPRLDVLIPNRDGPVPLAEITTMIPDLDTLLLGSFDLCDCTHCRSVLSPAAYLVDVLYFLKDRPSRIHKKNVKDILFTRRPDIGQIELTCENTNTLIPYVDLVNEVLENAISPIQFRIRTEFQVDLDNKVVTPEIMDEFKKNGFSLPSNASVSVEIMGSQWLIAHPGWRYVVNKDETLNQIEISGFPQTSWTAQELSANPEHVNTNALSTLEQVVYPWQFPFNFWNEEARIYLNHLGIRRSELMTIFQKSSLPISPTYKSIALAYLSVSKKERKIINGSAPENPWEFWGYQKESRIDELGIVRTWIDDLCDVQIFLQKSGLTYEELIELLGTRYINPQDPKTAIRIESKDPTDLATCNIEKLIIVDPSDKAPDLSHGLFKKVLDHFHRFKSLMQRLGWTSNTLDKAITSLNPIDLNDDFMVQLSNIQKISTDLQVSVVTILSWYSPIDTAKYDYKGFKVDCLYDQLFQNPAIVNLNPAERDLFKLNKARTELEISEKLIPGKEIRLVDNIDIEDDKKILVTLTAAFGISSSDFFVLVNSNKSVVSKSKELNLENLSHLYRTISFAKTLHLSIRDFLEIKDLTGINPFVKRLGGISVVNTDDTLRFIRVINKITLSDFNISELVYLFRNISLDAFGPAPREQDISLVLGDIRSSLQKIHTETAIIPDPTGDLSRKKLALLKLDNAVIEEVIAALDGSRIYSTPLSILPTGIVFETIIKTKVSYDGKNLRFMGPMTLDEKASMISASSDPSPVSQYRLAVNNLFDQPRVFIYKNMKAFEHPTFHASLDSLPSEVIFPTDLKDKIYYDVAAKKEELRFIGAMTETEKDNLLTLSGDILYQSAINDLFNAPDTYIPESRNQFLTSTDISQLFDHPTTIVEQRFNLVLAKLLTYLRDSLSQNLVKQKLSEALKLEMKIIEELVTKFVNLPSHPAKKCISEFLDPDFSETNPNISVTNTAFENQFMAFAILFKIGMIITRFKITPKQFKWLSDYSNGGSDWLNLNSLPVEAIDLKKSSDLFTAWTKLFDLFNLRDHLPDGETVLSDIFDFARESEATLSNTTAADLEMTKKNLQTNLLQMISENTGWDFDDLVILVGKDGFNFAFPESFRDDLAINQLRASFAMMKRLGMSASECLSLANPTSDLNVDDARRIKQGIKSNYDSEQWLTIIKPLHDDMREKERSLLVAYLLTHPNENRNQIWKDAGDLYQYFLIDVEMSACQMTSRIKQANSSIQLFVQRCLMNLENKEVLANTEEDNEWLNWKWMKNYRVWEANRKVFLYPENWIEPELRDDKTPFFQDLENEILQNEITKETSEIAFLHYLENLNDVARLEICGIYHQAEADTDILHVFGRTQGIPPNYYYRQRVDYQRVESARWTTWEKLELDIQNDHLIPIIWNRRLYLFWPIFSEKANDDPGIPDSGTKGGAPSKYLEIQLAWSEYRNNKWSAKKVFKDVLPYKYALPPILPYTKIFHFKVLQIEPELRFSIFVNEGNDNESAVTSYPSAEFILSGCNGKLSVVGFSNGKEKGLAPSIAPIGTYQKNMDLVYDGKTPQLHLQDFKAKIPYKDSITHVISSREDIPVLDRISSPFRLIMTHQEREPDLNMPFFFEDSTKTFFIFPNRTPFLTIWYKSDTVAPEILNTVPEYYYENSKAVIDDTPVTDINNEASNLLSDETPESVFGNDHIVATSEPVYIKSLKFQTHYHPYVCKFIKQINTTGIDGFMQRNIQQQSNSTLGSFNIEYVPTDIVEKPYPVEEVDFEYGGSYSLYNWELFFHAPLLIAERLSKNQQFEVSQKWFHYIFNPTDTSGNDVPNRYWQMKKFFDTTSTQYEKQKIQNLLNSLASGSHDYELENQVKEWRNNPFNPHLIARLRTTSYQLTVVMKYIDNLIAWGDQLFRRDTIESINEAVQLYVLAAEILGKRHSTIPTRALPMVQTYDSLENGLDDFANSWVTIEGILPASKPDRVVSSEVLPPILPSMLFFCLPQNDTLIKYWDTVDDRLFKIRHCMNIEGIVRQLPLFEPPIDPALLVRAVAAGVDISSALNDMNAALPHYRFNIIVQKATELCTEVKAFGSALLLALEKRDSEALSLLRSGQEINLLNVITEVKQKQIDEASSTLEGLKKYSELVTIRSQYYEQQLHDGLNSHESISQALSGGAILSQIVATVFDIFAGAAHLTPQLTLGVSGSFGSPVATATIGGKSAANSSQAFASAFHGLTSILNMGSSMSATMGNYERRGNEWDLQKKLAIKELEQIQKQIDAATFRQEISSKEKLNHELQIENAKEVNAYMQGRYTNEDLYNWMVGQLSSIYFQSYQLAYDVAKRAERAFQFELGIDDSKYIQFGYWDSLKKGLLAGERLHHDLKRMEMAYLDQNKREYEITKHISLMMLDPIALIKLKEKGDCFVDLPETIFDMDYPGHYMRRIKSVSLTIPCVTGPYTSINCRLTFMKNSIRKNVSTKTPEGTESYDRSPIGDDPRFVDNIGAVQSIVTSNGQNDSGLFELNFQDERYLPFEDAGAISQWRIELDKDSNRFDFNTISDVILHLRYKSRDGGEQLKLAAKNDLKKKRVTVLPMRLFSAKHEFSTAWYGFLNPSDNQVNQVLELDLNKERFPFEYDPKSLIINKIQIFVKLKNDFTYPTADKLNILLTSAIKDPPDAEDPSFKGTLDINGSIADLPNCKLPIDSDTFPTGILPDKNKKWYIKIDREYIPEWFRQKKQDDTTTDEFVMISGKKYYQINSDAIDDMGLLCFYSGKMREMS